MLYEVITGKKIIFRVKEKPLVDSVVVTGAEEIKEEEIRTAAGITPNSILNPYKVNEAVQKIKDLYKSKGYFNTEVNGQITTTRITSYNVCYTKLLRRIRKSV